MKYFRLLATLRAVRLPLIIPVLTGAFALSPAIAEDQAVEKNDAKKQKAILSPEVEAKFEKFLDKIKEAKGRSWALRMKKEIEKIVSVTGLNAESAKALEIPAKQAADACMDGWVAKIRDNMQPNLVRMPDQAMQILDQWMAQGGSFATGDWFGDYTRPFDHPLWIDAVHHALSPDQAAVWDKAQAEIKRVKEEKIGDFLKSQTDRMREQFHQEILVKSMYLQRTLALPKERASQLDALAQSAVDEAVKNWMKRADKILLSADDSMFNQIAKTGNFYLGPEKDETPAERSVWKDGIVRFLSSEESKQLEALQQELKSKRVQAMGQAMLALLDEHIAFTASQRQQLQPLTERMVKDEASLFPENESIVADLSPEMFFSAGAKATEEEMKPILDSIQWKHWQDLSKPKTKESTPLNTAAGISGIGNSTEQEDVEHAISDFLYEKAMTQQSKVTAESILKAEDAARVAGLNADVAARLHTAALGAAEESMSAWKSFVDQTVRSQLQGVNAENVKQRLGNIQSYYFQQNGNGDGNAGKNVIWDKSVKTELTDAQRAAWQKEIDGRKEFHDRTVAILITAEFARRHFLTLEQWSKLEPVMTGIVKDYGPEISGMFSSSNATPWYLQYYMMFMPVAGVPEKDLKAILTKEQWTQWQGSPEYSNSASNWQNIQQMHAQRDGKNN